MKILVTGATGGTGELVIKKLLSLGHSVIATSRDIEKAKKLIFYNDLTYIPYDFDKPLEIDLFSYFNKPDTVIHLAWDKLNDYTNQAHLTTILNSHKSFVFNLISNGLKDFNGIGTCYEYGLREGSLDENFEVNPTFSYSKAKNELKIYIEELLNNYNFTFKWIRIFYVFGEIKGRMNLYTLLSRAIEKGDKVFNMSGGEQIRDFLNPDEMAENIVEISLQNDVVGVVNCCSGKPVKLKDYVFLFLTKNHYQMELNLGHYPYLSYEPMQTWGTTTKLIKCKTFYKINRKP